MLNTTRMTAGTLSGVVRHWDDLAIISTMLVWNAAIGFWEEDKPDNAIEALKQRLAPPGACAAHFQKAVLSSATSCSSSRSRSWSRS